MAAAPARRIPLCLRSTNHRTGSSQRNRVLQRYDQFRQHVDAFIDMPERLIDLLFRFLYQNGGQLSNRAREKEFAALTNDEAERIEEIYAQTFGAD
ncbi:hypothetical protein MPLA_750109 [Mesorhizobium sp. ORS 3359]|nr:hypothetical protein MPLA_750109 [Mesorhizobium sp. ORS 3359]